MLRLKKLWVEDYKNLKELTIDFEAGNGFSMLIGTNGSGKSNILELISGIFHDVYLKKDFSILSDYIIEYSIYEENISITKKSGRRQIKINNAIQNIQLLKTNNLLPKNVVAIYSGEESRLWEDFYEKFYHNYIREINNLSKYSSEMKLIYVNKFYWDIALFAMLFSESVEIKEFMHKFNISKTNKIIIHFNKKNIDNSKNIILTNFIDTINKNNRIKMRINFKTLKKRLEKLDIHESELFKILIQSNLPKKEKLIENIKLIFDCNISTKEMSEGYKKLILVQAVLEFLGEENTLLLFDEPDSHINESMKNFLYQIMKKYNLPQIITTTHSPTLTQLATSNEKLILQTNEKGNASIVNCTNIEAIEKIGGGLWTANKDSIVFISQKPLILIEGPSDITCIKEAIKIFSKIDKKYLNIDCEFFPMGGASSAKHFIAQLKPCIKKDRKVIVIFDRDRAGGDAMYACINRGKDIKDLNIYREGEWFYFKLHKQPEHSEDRCVLEDCFKREKVKEVALNIVKDFNQDFNDYPKDLRASIKKRLEDEVSTYSKDDLKGFQILLDMILSIIEDTADIIDV